MDRLFEGKIMSKEINKKNVRPNHYSQDPNSIECIEVIKQLCKEHQNDVYVDYNRYQAFKYLWRAGKKGDVKTDLIKARTFIDFAIDSFDDN